MSLAVEAMLYPTMVAKTHLQTLSEAGRARGGAVRILADLARREGMRGMYRGFVVGAVGGIPGEAVFFATYEFAKESMLKAHAGMDENGGGGGGRRHEDENGGDARVARPPPPWVPAAAGFLAEITSAFVGVPFEVISTRLQIAGHESGGQQGKGRPGAHAAVGQPQNHHHRQPSAAPPVRYNGTIDAFRRTVAAEGVRGLFRGCGATIVTYAPSSAIFWTVYESSKVRLDALAGGAGLRGWLGFAPHRGARISSGVQSEDPLVHGIAAMSASSITTPLFTPFDVAKTRLQTQHIAAFEGNTAAGGPRYRHMWDVLVSMRREHGIRSLYRGLVPRLVFGLPAALVAMISYEQVKIMSIDDEVD
jgi:solute carrier family 25 protein 44